MSRLSLRTIQRKRFRLAWAIILAIILLLLALWGYKEAASIRTHSLPVGNITLSVPYSKYLVNETITFTLKNNYNSPFFFANGCPSEPLRVYRLEGGVWVRLHDTASVGACPSEERQIVVPANGTVSGNFAAWHNLFNQPGRYRVVAFVEYYSALLYQDFDVIAVPAPIHAVVPPTSSAITRPSLRLPLLLPLTRPSTPLPSTRPPLLPPPSTPPPSTPPPSTPPVPPIEPGEQ